MSKLFKSFSIGTRMIVMLGLNLIMFMATAAFGIYYLSAIETEIRAIADRDMPITEAISGVTAHQLEQVVLFERVMRLASVGSVHALEMLEKTQKDFVTLNAKVDEELLSVLQTTETAIAEAHTEEARAEFQHVLEVLERAEREHKAFAEQSVEAFRLVNLGRNDAAANLAEEIEAQADKLDHELQALLDEVEAFTEQALKTAEEHEHAGLVALASLAAAGLLLGLPISFMIFRMSASIARQATESRRIKIALDNCNTNVMVADIDLNIVYMNRSVESMLRSAESDLRKELPHFDANNLIGQSVDVFHKNPAHQRGLLEGLTGTYKAEIEVAGNTFGLVANPVIDDNGKRIGTSVEWADRTTERKVEKEIDSVVAAAVNGDFSQRVELEGKEGFMRNLAEAINKISATTSEAIEDVAASLSALAEGDLTRRIDRNYNGLFEKLKDDCNATAQQLENIVTDIVEAANEMANAADEITTGTTDLSQRTEQQASNLQETASSMEEMPSTVKQNADNAQQANQLSISTRDVATKGGEVVGNAVEAMSRIDKSSQKISDIIGVIDEIAFQTNLLALNAAVEAARAGDAGKGFAVVASEVRTQAQRSSQAAKDIKALIVDSGGQVKEGVELVNNAGQSLDEIVDSIKRLSDIVSEIAAASGEQTNGIDEINKAVAQMDEATQQNSALVEESAAASRTLQEQSEGMRQRMQFFKFAAEDASIARAGKSAKSAFSAKTHGPTVETAPVEKPAPKKVAAAGGGIAEAPVASDDWSEF